MSMNKKILFLIVCFFSFCFFTKEVKAIDVDVLEFDTQTEEIVYSVDASWVKIRKLWLECEGDREISISLYNGGTSVVPVKSGRVPTNNVQNGYYDCRLHVATASDDDDTPAGEGYLEFTKRNYDPNAVNNPTHVETTNECSRFNTEKKCNAIASCKWFDGECDKNYVALEACDEDSIKQVLRFFGYLLLIAKVAIPLIIIAFGTLDLFKSVIDKDEGSLGKQTKRLIMRIITGVIVFFVPNLVHGLFKISDTLNVVNTDDYEMCATCLLDPTNCSVNGD